jgi:hypothetical protein
VRKAAAWLVVCIHVLLLLPLWDPVRKTMLIVQGRCLMCHLYPPAAAAAAAQRTSGTLFARRCSSCKASTMRCARSGRASCSVSQHGQGLVDCPAGFRVQNLFAAIRQVSQLQYTVCSSPLGVKAKLYQGSWCCEGVTTRVLLLYCTVY